MLSVSHPVYNGGKLGPQHNAVGLLGAMAPGEFPMVGVPLVPGCSFPFAARGMPEAACALPSVLVSPKATYPNHPSSHIRVGHHVANAVVGRTAKRAPTASNFKLSGKTNIYIRQLPFKTTEWQVEQFFSAFGNIASFMIMRDIHTGRSRGSSFVRFSTHSEAVECMRFVAGHRMQSVENQVAAARAILSGLQSKDNTPQSPLSSQESFHEFILLSAASTAVGPTVQCTHDRSEGESTERGGVRVGHNSLSEPATSAAFTRPSTVQRGAELNVTSLTQYLARAFSDTLQKYQHLVDSPILARTLSVSWAYDQFDGDDLEYLRGGPVGSPGVVPSVIVVSKARYKIRKLLVRNVPISICAEAHLTPLFSFFGKVNAVTLHKDTAPATEERMRRNIAFVRYAEDGCAERAARFIHNSKPFVECGDIPLMVKLAEENHYRFTFQDQLKWEMGCGKAAAAPVEQQHPQVLEAKRPIVAPPSLQPTLLEGERSPTSTVNSIAPLPPTQFEVVDRSGTESTAASSPLYPGFADVLHDSSLAQLELIPCQYVIRNDEQFSTVFSKRSISSSSNSSNTNSNSIPLGFPQSPKRSNRLCISVSVANSQMTVRSPGGSPFSPAHGNSWDREQLLPQSRPNRTRATPAVTIIRHNPYSSPLPVD